jgi:Flp pilus assembly pilin Flp
MLGSGDFLRVGSTSTKNRRNVMSAIKRFMKDEQGLETVEYAVILALIVVGTLFAVGLLRDSIINRFTETADIIDGAGEGGE